MVLSEHALRKWKLATYVATSATAIHLVFYNEYQIPGYQGKHCFTDIQRFYRQWVDRNVWGQQNLTAPATDNASSQQQQQPTA
ncbi:expressed unknown protein [Seminavis robusta]|uniref:Uncharacterized protein n=1 Tax=Seminavis robusta TaxID=568900 RepID=A0A9N8HI99_9STRA|nr:expressed unknown protein [Seminavis robusta]|eukprot:Sro581_g170360.1 n/a (83) ;mRNA; r:46200-46561